MDALREAIEKLVGEYCDGVFNGLERAHFISYFGEKKKHTPQELADRLMELFEEFSYVYTERD